MKENKKIITSVVLFAIAIILLSTMATTSAKAGNKKMMNKYIALGDSIAVPDIGEDNVSYASLISDFFLSLNSSIEYENLSESGITSQELLVIIKDNKEKIRDADLITISIGGNNILNPILNGLTTKLNTKSLDQCTYEELEMALKEVMNTNEFKEEINKSYESFKSDLKEIKSIINSLAPQAEVYINTLYNPLEYEGDTHDYFEQLICEFNNIIKSEEEAFNIIDAYELLKKQALDEVVVEKKFINIHPTKAGHAILASQVISDYGEFVSLSIDKITNSSEYISGKTVPLTNIIILSENGVIGTTKTNIDGEFKLKTTPLESGTNIQVFVYDKSLFSILYKFEKLEVRKALFTS